uniref:Kelch domain-containing protein family protein n=1 Tax=Wuchereria bancrofti TaxID=6293 RepID=A0A1I8EUM6_WUCBA
RLWITLAVFHRCLVALSIQLLKAEDVIKSRTTSQIVEPSPIFEIEQQQEIAEETVVRLVSSENSSRIPLPHMESPRCSVRGALINGKIIICGGYYRGKCLESVGEYNLLEKS